MKITILTNYDLPALLAINYLLPSLREHQISVYYTQKTSIKKLPPQLQSLADFEHNVLSKLDGSPYTEVEDSPYSEVEDSQDNVVEDSQNERSLLSFKQLRRYTDDDITRLNSVNESDFERLHEYQPDLIVSIRHMTILGEEVIALPKLGVINLHSGLLPDYQGVMSTFRAMAAKEPLLGSTLHFIEDRSIDSGAIIARSMIATRTDKSYFWNVLSLYKEGCQLILNAIAVLASETDLDLCVQQGPARYYSYPNDAELNEFNKQGLALFDSEDLTDYLFSRAEFI